MAEKFETEQVIEIFDADTEFIGQVGILTFIQKQNLAELLIDNKTTIADDTARDLATSNYLAGNIAGLSIPSSFNDLLQIYYTFKYAAIKLFFRENYHKYIPEYDLYQIKKNNAPTESDKAKTQLLTEAYMREFDKFSLVIDNVAYAQDLNRVPYEYLNYLAQIIGYQRDDYLLLTNVTFRELLKNIIEIYKIKGSNYSFELFFNFLGFDITINEYWFDRRYSDAGIVTNQYTGSVDKKSYLFYLTPVKPTATIPDDMLNPYTINEDQITSPRNILMFLQYTGWNTLGDTRGFTYSQLIGDTRGYTGDTYTWFKTNVIQYSLSSLGSDQEPELSADELGKIEFYAEFLSPVYVQRQISVAAAPYEESTTGELGFKYLDRADPIYRERTFNGREYYVQSIDANLGDTLSGGDTTYDSRALVIVSDADQKLYNWIHRGDYIYLTGDTTAGDTNQGSYFVAGDSYIEKIITYDISDPSGWIYTVTGDIGDSFVIEGDTYKIYDAINSETWVLLKGPLSSSAKGSLMITGFRGEGDTIEPARYGDTYLGTDQASSGGYLWIGGPDKMMQLHQGDYPARYYWGDTLLGDSAFTGYGDTRSFTAVSGDSILAFNLFIGDTVIETHNFISRMSVTYLTSYNGDTKFTQTIVKEIGDTYIVVEDPIASGDSYGFVFIDNRQHLGHYLSGHHIDTHFAVYGDSINGDTNAISAYAVIKNANPTWSDEQVFIEINAKEADGTLYDYETTTFKVRDRDLFVMVDTVRKQYPGDSIISFGDSFNHTVGDSIIYFGDSHFFEANQYILIGGNKYFVNQTGDTWIELSPFGDTTWGAAYKMPNWKKYTAINSGDTNSSGDSIYDFHLGFINPVLNNVIDFSTTAPLTLGANFPIIPEDSGRPIETQELVNRQRRDYWTVNYSSGDTQLNAGQVYEGNSSGSKIWMTVDAGDSNFRSIYSSDGSLTIGEDLQPMLYSQGDTFGIGDSWYIDINGDSVVIDSITKSTDQHGLILNIDASAGIVQVYDPGDAGDSFISEWANLIWDDYIVIYEANDSSNNGEYRVSSATRTIPGDTTVITLGDSIIEGVDQTGSGGYICSARKVKIKSLVVGTGIIEIHDSSRKFYGLVDGDTIVIADTGDSNEGYYIVGDSIFHIRSGSGDSVGVTTLLLTTALDHDSGDSGGTIELNGNSWILGDSAHQKGFDFIEMIKMR
jgi:hypothetical protein